MNSKKETDVIIFPMVVDSKVLYIMPLVNKDAVSLQVKNVGGFRRLSNSEYFEKLNNFQYNKTKVL